MRITRCVLEWDGGEAEYREGDDDRHPVLTITVVDLDDARAILDTLERSRARYSPAGEATASPAVPAGDVVPNEKCEVSGCSYDAEKDGRCRNHAKKVA